MSIYGRDLPAPKLGGEFENVAILVAIAVNEGGYREVLDAAERMKELDRLLSVASKPRSGWGQAGCWR